MLIGWHGDSRGDADRADADERTTLEGWVRSGMIEHRLVERARVVLLAAAGMASRRVVREVGCARGWSANGGCGSARDRLAGLADAPRPGKPKTYDAAVDRRILAALDRPPPAGFAAGPRRCSPGNLAMSSDQHIWRFLRAQRIDLAGRRSWCLSSDPEFVAKAADIVGLYLAPPDHAIVLAVDEKPAIQALERRRAIELPNGRSLHGQAHEAGAAARPPCSRRSRSPPVNQGQTRAPAARRVPRLHERGGRRLSRPGDPRRPRQPADRQAQARSLAGRHKNVHFHFTPTHVTWLTRSRSGSRSSPGAPSKAQAPPRSGNCAKPSTPYRGRQPDRRALPMAQGHDPSQGPRLKDHSFMMAGLASIVDRRQYLV